MFKNYFKLARRTLMRNKSNTLLNVAGLSIGIAACIVIFLLVQFELSFDDYHKNKDRIYRVVTHIISPDGTDYSRGVPIPTADALRTDFPQLEQVAPIAAIYDPVITINKGLPSQKVFKENDGVFYAGPNLFGIFDFTWLQGNPTDALSEPNTVVLTRDIANKYFGDWKNAIGKTLHWQPNTLLKVTGILENPPSNTELGVSVVVSYKTFKPNDPLDWRSVGSSQGIFILLPEGVTQAAFQPLLTAFNKRHLALEGNINNKIALQHLSDVHYDERYGSFTGHTISRKLINTLALIGLFLLVVACINFVNLATAQSVYRAKEVGVRKVLGSKRNQLIGQFMAETVLVTFISLLLALGLAWLSLPLINNLLSLSISLYFLNNVSLLVFLVVCGLMVALLSGLYPSLVLAGVNPIAAFKRMAAGPKAANINLRRGLVVLQFAIAQILIIGTAIIVSQLNYFKGADLGFSKEAVLMVPIPTDSTSRSKMETFKNLFFALPNIKYVSFSLSGPANNGSWFSDFKFDTAAANVPFASNLKWADAAYFDTYGLTLVAGRTFSPSDTVREFVVNEKLVTKLGFKDANAILGKRINFWDGGARGEIIGVVKDYYTNSLVDELPPVVMSTYKNTYRTAGIKLTGNNLLVTTAAIERLWNQTYPGQVYEGQWLDERIADFYQEQQQLATLYKLFAGIAIFISCLGLYGLVSFMAVQRTKEVGIRKVLGASVGNILYMFSKEFSLLIAVAFLIAVPVSWYYMQQWLQNFANRVQPGPGIFILTILLSLAIAWLTVGYRAVKAALANPVKSLRTE